MEDKFVNDRFPVEPISREELRGLKAKIDDVIRLGKVKRFVDDIFKAAVIQAKTSHARQYIVPFDSSSNAMQMKEYKAEILQQIIHLFPGCKISYCEMCPDIHGKWHDLSTIDPEIYKYLNLKIKKESIMIDWS